MKDDIDIEIRPSDLVCHNVLAMAEVNSPLDLVKVVGSFKFSEYDETKFSCVRVRLSKFRCTVSIFSTGKLQVTGARNPEDAHEALQFVAYRLKKKSENEIIFSNFKIENILATFDIGSRMDLYGLSQEKELTVTYMPSQFAAAVVREVSTGVVVDVFSSGKMNIKGKVGIETLCKGVNILMPRISRYICEELL